MLNDTRSLSRVALGLAAVALLFAVGCSTTAPAPKPGKKDEPRDAEPARRSWTRDWSRFPAVAVQTTTEDVVALGDVHGGYDRLVRLLETNGLIARDAASPAGYAWAGGRRTLVCTGDLIDKGSQSIPVLDLMMALEGQADAAGGRLVVTMGNHEAEFLADPGNDKAPEFRDELAAKGVDPASLPLGEERYGVWLMNRPVAAKVNDWFFAHGGNTDGRTIERIASDFTSAVDAGKWGAKSLTGDDSILEAREWWEAGKSKRRLDEYLDALGASHIVFGHDPSALGAKGEIEAAEGGRIILIDVGMSPAIDYSEGALLVISTRDGATTAVSVDASGARRVVLGPGAKP
jgi:hypothetical protein